MKQKEHLPQEVRDAVRAFRHHTGQSAAMLPGVVQQELSSLESGRYIPVSTALKVIKTAWGFESFDALLAAAKDLPLPPAKKWTESVKPGRGQNEIG